MQCSAGKRGLFVGAENRSRTPLASRSSNFKVNGHDATRAPYDWDHDSSTCHLPSRETPCIGSSVLNSSLGHDRRQDTPVGKGPSKYTLQGRDADQKVKRIPLVLSAIQNADNADNVGSLNAARSYNKSRCEALFTVLYRNDCIRVGGA
jgi:hypothetical protein